MVILVPPLIMLAWEKSLPKEKEPLRSAYQSSSAFIQLSRLVARCLREKSACPIIASL